MPLPSFDNSFCANVAAATNLTYAFTVGSGSNRVMVVFVRHSSESDVLTAVTVNSAAPDFTFKSFPNGAPYHSMYLYVFNSPATGSATVSITASVAVDINSGAITFVNASQWGLDALSDALLGGGTNFIVTTNPVANNTMLGMFVWNSAVVPTAGNNVTLKSQDTAANSSTTTAWVDTTNISNAQIFPSVTSASNTAFAGFTFTIAPVATVTLQTSTVIDRNTRTKPPVPILGAAGFQFNDPKFGTWIARVTDKNSTSADPDNPASGESFNLNANTTQHGWSPDSKHFYVQRTDGNFWIMNFDPIGLTTTFGRVLLLYNDITWDSNNPNFVYGSLTSAPNHHTVGKADITSVPYVYSTLFDAATVVGPSFPAGDTFLNTIMCAKGNLVVLCGGPQQDAHFLVIWYPLANPGSAQVLNTLTRPGMGFHLHSLQIDQTGRFVMMGPAVADNAPFLNYIWDTTLNTVTPITFDEAGHTDIGANFETINQDSIGTFDGFQYIIRNLTNPDNTAREVIAPLLTPSETFVEDHSCANDAQVGNALVFTSSTYRTQDANGWPYTYTSSPQNTTPWRACDGEVLQVNTNIKYSSNTPLRRICHNRALADSQTNGGNGFLNQPLLNVSPNGLWCLFQSNWDGTLGNDSVDGNWRRDVFLAYLGPPTIQSILTPPAICFSIQM